MRPLSNILRFRATTVIDRCRSHFRVFVVCCVFPAGAQNFFTYTCMLMYLYELVKPQAVCRLTVRHWEENYTLYSTVGTGSKREKSLNPLSTALPSWGQSTQFLSSLSPKRACGSKRVNTWYSIIQLRRGVLNRTYGKHKNLYISLFLVTIFGPIYYGPPLRSTHRTCHVYLVCICIGSWRVERTHFSLAFG